jgi:predicted transcriptional regulator
MAKIVITLSVKDETNDTLDRLAELSDRKRSAIVDMAVELLAKQPEFSTRKQVGKQAASARVVNTVVA